MNATYELSEPLPTPEQARFPELSPEHEAAYEAIERQSKKEYEATQELACMVGRSVGASPDEIRVTGGLVKDLYRNTANTANHCARVAVLNTAVTERMAEAGFPANRRRGFLASYTHDLGKDSEQHVPFVVIKKSIVGKGGWPEEYREAMHGHVPGTVAKLQASELRDVAPDYEEIEKVAANHHGVQERGAIGSIEGLDPETAADTVGVAIADNIDAAHRNDEHEANQGEAERLAFLIRTTQHKLDVLCDYLGMPRKEGLGEEIVVMSLDLRPKIMSYVERRTAELETARNGQKVLELVGAQAG